MSYTSSLDYSLTPPTWCRDLTPSLVSQWIAPLTCHRIHFYSDRILEQSNVVSLRLLQDTTSGTETDSSSSSSSATASSSTLLPSLFVKRACVKWLAQRINKSTEKWIISATSFGNEQYFNAYAPGQRMIEFGCGIPYTYYSNILPYYDENGKDTGTDPIVSVDSTLSPLESVYTTVCEQLPLDKYTEYRHFNYDQTISVLQWCAKLHALFHIDIVPSTSVSYDTSTTSLHEPSPPLSYTQRLRPGLFSAGGWWRKELRPSVKYGTLYQVFQQHCKDLPSYRCAERFRETIDTPANHQLVEALSHDHCIQEIHNASVNDRPIRTIVHGDLKPSNIFFTKDNVGTANPQVKVIDWQWTGCASTGAVDLAYLFAGGILYDTLTRTIQQETEFLDYYYKEYMQALQSLTTNTTILHYTRDQLQDEYERELVIYWTTAMPYLLDNLTLDLCQANAQKYGWLTHEEDERMTAWLTWRVLQILRTKGKSLFPKLKFDE